MIRLSTDLARLSAAQLLAHFKAGTLSPVEAVQATLQRVERLGGPINAFRTMCAERALAAARKAGARYRDGSARPLDGLPFSAKDTLTVAGLSCRRGSPAMPDVPEPESAPVVAHAEQAGAALIGITTTPEFGAGPVTISPLTGITRNPWDTRMNAGGSSGGAAAATASGFGSFALATDAGGSSRIPAALCGVVGFKPTGGRLPTWPPNVAGTLSAPGLIARSVEDVALLMNVCAARDPRDPEMLPPDGRDYAAALDARAPGFKAPGSVRIAFSTDLGFARRVDPEIRAAVVRAAEHLRGLGYQVEEAAPAIDDPTAFFMTLFQAGFAYTSRHFSEAQLALIGPKLKEAIAAGAKVPLFDYMAAQDMRRALARTLNEFHERYDFLLTPTTASTAFDAERWVPPDFEDLPNTRAWVPFTSLFNICQQPAISVPCGLSGRGLPIGLQIAGPRFSDAAVLRLAHHLFETSSSAALGPRWPFDEDAPLAPPLQEPVR